MDHNPTKRGFERGGRSLRAAWPLCLLLSCGTAAELDGEATAEANRQGDDRAVSNEPESPGDTAAGPHATDDGASNSFLGPDENEGIPTGSLGDAEPAPFESLPEEGAAEADMPAPSPAEVIEQSNPTTPDPMAANSAGSEQPAPGPTDEAENGQTGSAIPPIPCEPMARTLCNEASDCDAGQICDVARDWELACDVTFLDNTCDAPCQPGDCPDFYECGADGRCALTSCVEGSTPCPGTNVCDPESVDLAGGGSPSTRAGCIPVLCDHPEGPKCSDSEVCDPSTCTCVELETGGTQCTCEPGGNLLDGCRNLPCDHPNVTCGEHFTCDPGNERANDIGCVPARCDLGEVDCTEVYEASSICRPECGLRFGCVTLKEGSDECGRLPPGPDQY